ncbi:MAG: hypothetical protein EBV53_09645, partial [Proteobacteria bacterium]|nr:hypothetical protein [Pseudomonadota bacterium]
MGGLRNILRGRRGLAGLAAVAAVTGFTMPAVMFASAVTGSDATVPAQADTTAGSSDAIPAGQSVPSVSAWRILARRAASSGGGFMTPTGIAMDRRGVALVTLADDDRVWLIANDGSPATPWPPSERFVVASSAGTLLADHDTLVAKGLDTFPDGLVSVVPTATPGVYDFYANQGNGSDGMGGSLGTGFGRTRGTLQDPFAVVMDTRGPIVNPIVPVDYMGGGAVWRNATTGALV